ncbi:MAG: hypothetical protein J7M24_02600 [Candidatus Latescibacteria bacterium]|nr:hypothetical protein [Candidatus Latescibacterota bacterium]
MNRRQSMSFIPLTFAGIAETVRRAAAEGIGEAVTARPGDRPLSAVYAEKARDMLLEVRRTQSENLLEASYAIARTVMNGGRCWNQWDMGHSTSYDLAPGRNGLPEIITDGFDPDRARDGDCFLANRRSAYPVLDEKDIFVIGSPSPWSLDAQGNTGIELESAMYRVRPYADIWIETNITRIGSVIRVPGMPAPMGPVSGILGLATFWMMMADACRVLARDGHPVPVRGDEKPLADNAAGQVSLYAPLMDDYFDALLMELDMIGAEMGALREIARMAADSVLSGGKVYGFSRYMHALAYEAQQRRGGMSLTYQGLYDKEGEITALRDTFEPGGGDTVVMGIFEPDNPEDLRCLDLFRGYGMKVASIGPMTRGRTIPPGRTVPKEADVHIGRMCDTYGLFAVPGFERKVCPTSGVLQCQLWHTLQFEIFEEMIRRTNGNIPYVYLNGAVRGGMEHVYRTNAVYRERGY